MAGGACFWLTGDVSYPSGFQGPAALAGEARIGVSDPRNGPPTDNDWKFGTGFWDQENKNFFHDGPAAFCGTNFADSWTFWGFEFGVQDNQQNYPDQVQAMREQIRRLRETAQ